MKRKVFIIILNWNGYRDTDECIRSLMELSYPSYQIVVVDNGSTDGSVARLKEEFKEIVCIANKENLGFAGGNNVGVRYALEHEADYVLLLNNDTIVAPSMLDKLVEAGEADAGIGILGAKIYCYPESSRLWGAGGEIDWMHGKTYHIGYHEPDDGQWNRAMDVDYVSGCALMVKRGVLEKAGLLDERYFLYYEETDFCIRARNKGFRVLYVPEAKLWHKVSSTTGGGYGPIYTYYMTRNRLLFMRRYLDDVSWKRFLLYFYYDGLLRRAAFLLCKSKRPVESLKALWSGLRDFKAGKFYKGPEWLHQGTPSP